MAIKCLSVQNCCVAKQLTFFPGAHQVKAMTDEEIIREMVRFHKTYYNSSFFAIVNAKQDEQMDKIFKLFKYQKYPFCMKSEDRHKVYMYVFDRECPENFFRKFTNFRDSFCDCAACRRFDVDKPPREIPVIPEFEAFKKGLKEQFGIEDFSFINKIETTPLANEMLQVQSTTVPIPVEVTPSVFATTRPPIEEPPIPVQYTTVNINVGRAA